MTDVFLPRVAAGEFGAMQECMRAYGGLIWRLVRRFASGDEDPEDLVQEVFTDLWRCAHRFDPDKGSELAFVSTITRRRLIDSYRRRQRAGGTIELESPSDIPDAPGKDPLEVADEVQRVRDALETLKPEQREVLDLCLTKGLTQLEISERTGMPLGTVKSHARRGLMRVRGQLGVAPDHAGGAA